MTIFSSSDDGKERHTLLGPLITVGKLVDNSLPSLQDGKYNSFRNNFLIILNSGRRTKSLNIVV
jgi:hypothetical protein